MNNPIFVHIGVCKETSTNKSIRYMKKNRLLSIIAAVASVLSSCDMSEMDLQPSNPAEGPSLEKREVIITASLDEADPQTRTSRGADGNIYWSPADEIKIFSAGETAKFVSLNTAPAAQAQFRGEISFVSGAGEDGSVNYTWALYPYREDAYYDDAQDAVVTTMPAFQKSLAKTFSDKTALSLGKSTAMAFSFKNAYSGLRLRFYRDDIVSVTVKGMDGEVLAGKVAIGLDPLPVVKSNVEPAYSITMVPTEGTFLPTSSGNDNDYYIITLPDIELQRGLAITLRRKDGYEGTYYHSTAKLERNRFKNLTEALDTRIEKQENISNGISTGWHRSTTQAPNEIWYTSTASGGSLYYRIPEGSVNEVAEYIDPADNGGIGIIRFTAALKEIDDRAFNHENSLKTVSLPETVEIIGEWAFQDCYNLEQVTMGDNVKIIRSQAFGNCAFETIRLSEGLETIGAAAFNSDRFLKTVDIPESVQVIGYSEGMPLTNPFDECPALESFSGKYASEDGLCLVIDDKLVSFASASQAGGIYTVPGNIKHIMANAFYGATVGGVELPEGLLTIYDAAFAACSNLKEIVLPSTLEAIYFGAFYGCNHLQKIVITRADKAMEIRSSYPEYLSAMMVFHGTNNCPIYVPSNLLQYYVYGQYWDTYGIKLGDLNRYRILAQPNEIYYTTTNDASVYYNVDGNTGNVVDLDNCVYPYANNGIGIIRFMEPVTVIDEEALMDCNNLKSVILPPDVKTISFRAFSGCYSLQEVTLPEGLERIEYEAFSYCERLESITIPQSVTELGYYSIFAFPFGNPFNGCTGLKHFYGKFASDDGYSLIQGTEFLSFATGDWDADSCYIIPDNVQRIRIGAFENATFGGVTLPDGLITLLDFAFLDCRNLKEITIPENVSRVGFAILKNCTSLESITLKTSRVPITITSFGSYGHMFDNTNDCDIYILESLAEEYLGTEYWSDYAERYCLM